MRLDKLIFLGTIAAVTRAEVDCSPYKLFHPSNGSGYPGGSEVVYQGSFYKSTAWTNGIPGATPEWALKDKCTAASAGGHTVDCTGYKECKENVVCTPGDAYVKDPTSGQAMAINCSYQSTPQGCPSQGLCKPGTAGTTTGVAGGGVDCSKIPPIPHEGGLYKDAKSLFAKFPPPPGVIGEDGNLYVKTGGKRYLVDTYCRVAAGSAPACMKERGTCKGDSEAIPEVDCSSIAAIFPNEAITDGKIFHQNHKLYVNAEYDSGKGPVNEQNVMLGACKAGTEKTAQQQLPATDCSKIPLWKKGFQYNIANVPNAPQGLDPNSIKVKYGGTVYTMKSYPDKNLTPEENAGAGWTRSGHCTDPATAETEAVFDCTNSNKMVEGAIGLDAQYISIDDYLYMQTQYSAYYIGGLPGQTEIIHKPTHYPLGKCLPNTSNFKRPTNEIDCTTYPYWNKKKPYAQGLLAGEIAKAQIKGIGYHASTWSQGNNPEIPGTGWKAIGSCTASTVKTPEEMEKCEYDYNDDQKAAVALCCPSAECAYFTGVFQCYPTKQSHKNQWRICPFESIKGHEEEYHALGLRDGSYLKKYNITTCEQVKDHQIMDFYNGEIEAPRTTKDQNWPDRAVAPFTDGGLAQQPDLTTFLNLPNGNKIDHFFIAFAQASGNGNAKLGCRAQLASVVPIQVGPRTWPRGQTRFLYDDFNKIRKAGGNWAIGLGGYNGVELAMAPSCIGANEAETVKRITEAYLEIIDYTKVNVLNFDIEAGASAMNERTTSWPRRFNAIKELKRIIEARGQKLTIQWTVGIMPEGLMDKDLAHLFDAFAAGVPIDLVLPMTMDYGPGMCPSTGDKAIAMSACEQSAIANLAKQMYAIGVLTQRLGTGMQSPESMYPLIGSIPMLGVNDVSDEHYLLEDALNAVEMHKHLGLGAASFWSITRDRACKGEDKGYDNQTAAEKNFLKGVETQLKGTGTRGTNSAVAGCHGIEGYDKDFTFSYTFSDLTTFYKTLPAHVPKFAELGQGRKVTSPKVLKEVLRTVKPEIIHGFPANLNGVSPIQTPSVAR